MTTPPSDVQFRPMRADDAPGACALAIDCLEQCIAWDCSEEGIQHFLTAMTPDVFSERLAKGNIFWVAENASRIVGLIEIAGRGRISKFFVDRDHRRCGIGRVLFSRALTDFLCHVDGCNKITVRASRYAVPVYEKLGFCIVGEEQVVDGIRFVPMRLKPIPPR